MQQNSQKSEVKLNVIKKITGTLNFSLSLKLTYFKQYSKKYTVQSKPAKTK